jgi:hypothetical protein
MVIWKLAPRGGYPAPDIGLGPPLPEAVRFGRACTHARASSIANFMQVGMADLPFSLAPFDHVLAIDNDKKFREVVERNLNTKFEKMDLLTTPNKDIRKMVESNANSNNIHVTLCLCCRPASCASGDIKYKDVVNMIKNAAALTVELSNAWR